MEEGEIDSEDANTAFLVTPAHLLVEKTPEGHRSIRGAARKTEEGGSCMLGASSPMAEATANRSPANQGLVYGNVPPDMPTT